MLNCPFKDSAQINLSADRRELIGMHLIMLASYGGNTASRTSNLHLAVSGSINSLSSVSGSKNCQGDATLYIEDVGSHLLPLTLILAPLPTLHQSRSLTNFWAAIILRHIYDGLLPSDVWINSHFGRYFALRTRNTNEFWPN